MVHHADLRWLTASMGRLVTVMLVLMGPMRLAAAAEAQAVVEAAPFAAPDRTQTSDAGCSARPSWPAPRSSAAA